MTRRLTIRTKILATLALVLAISAVLTINTLFGLYSYRDSIRKFSAKTDELQSGGKLWDRVAELGHPNELGQLSVWGIPAGEPSNGPPSDFEGRIENVRRALADYRAQVRKSLSRGRDPDDGQTELPLLAKIDDELRELASLPPFPYWEDDEKWLMDLAVDGERMADRRRFRSLVAMLQASVGDLPFPMHHDMVAVAEDAKSTYCLNLWIGWSTGVLVLAMLLVLARLTYKWIFHPIKLLHRSVQRVGRIDQAPKIELNTGDEMQELAGAFNDMIARLQGIHRDLERQVDERGRQLVRSEQLASVGFLAAGVAHEINNPLASISLGAEALERRLKSIVPSGTADAEQVSRLLTMVQSEAFRCKGITEKLLDFSRLRDHERQLCSLSSLVADVIDMVQHMGRYREKQIVLASTGDVQAPVNSQEIKQVILNLVVNALDSMEPGGMLQIEVSEESGNAVMVFSDDGCGMTPEILRNIFEPFFTRCRTGKGTGLGLSISHRIISDHHGQIEAASDGPGRGSRFTVRLPLACPDDKETSRYEQLAA